LLIEPCQNDIGALLQRSLDCLAESQRVDFSRQRSQEGERDKSSANHSPMVMGEAYS
jgi:hypothetical protein